MNATLWQKLIALKDELALQSHLLSMDAKDKYEALLDDIEELEQRLVKHAEKLGQKEEAFFVAEHTQIESLVQSLKDIQKQKKD